MGWGKPFSKKGWGTTLAKVAATAVGGIFGGPAGAALAGGAVGGMGGGGLKGAATGAALGGAGALLAGGLGTAAGSPMSGGMQGATQGSGLTGLFTGGGSNLGSVLSGAGTASFGGGLFGGGSSAGAPATSSLSSLFGGGGAVNPSALSSDAGVLSGGSGVSSMFGGGGSTLGGIGSLAKYALPVASIFSGLQQNSAINDMEEQKLEMERQRLAQLQPYNQSGQAANTALANKLASGELGGQFNALDLSSDPVYQSQLAEGQSALDRKASASGSVFSGAALRDAAKYSSDLAAQKQNEAYQRWLGQQQNTYNQLSGQSSQGLNAAAGVGNVYSGMGDITSGATGAQSNNLNSTLADLLNGSYGKKATIINGQVVYV